MSVTVAAKRLGAPIAAWAAGRRVPARRIRAAILCYHGVARRATPEHVGAAAFEAQLRRVVGSGRCRSLAAIVDDVIVGPSLQEGVDAGLALTFDDGYANLLEHVVPTLRSLTLPATVFVVPGRLGCVADWPSPAPAGERRLLSLGEVETLRSAGLAVGAHGWTHADLTACSAQQRADEIGQCFEFLAGRLDDKKPVFCYPWGRFDDAVVAEVRRAGFVAAVAGGWGRWHGRADLFNLRRIAVDWTDTVHDFGWKLRGGYGWWTASWWRELRDSREAG